uniref:Coiled-coil domain-containing protein 57 isoform X2 n=1 Tax=Geotrypetes seraphini TaxID=260995 RepID=A0A6P8SD27_GEOSA|nr:coiled-coil domain-containing protein 57 isoform X2 [Geotrypetes seraphini]
MMLQQEKNLGELLASKAQEWKELQVCQTQLLESALQGTSKQLQEQQEKFRKLKEDFMHNLQVLEEREKQLKEYDAIINKLKVTDSAKQSEVSSLRIQVEKLQQIILNESRMREELQYQYQQRLREHKIELEKLHSSKDSDIDHHQEAYKKLKCQLERKIKEVEGELALQRQELLLEFDAEMKKQEHEFNLQMNEMNTVVLSHELKVKMLMKELEIMKLGAMTATESLQTAEAKIQELEEKVKCQDWELKDLAILKDARVKELEDKIQRLQLSWTKKEEAFQRKYEQLDRLAREKDAALAAVKKSHAEKMEALENQICHLQISNETLVKELHRMERGKADALAEKEAIIQKLQEELNTLQSGWDSHIAEISKETASVNLQVQSLEQEKAQLKAELARSQQDIDRYRQQLSQALEKERVLEQEKVQVALDWKKFCEDAERKQYEKSEELIQGLTTAREQALAVLEEKERKLQEMETVVSALTFERHLRIQMPPKHGVLPERGKQTLFYDSQTVIENEKLQEENTGLKAVIAEMRKEMEALCNDSAAALISAQQQIPVPGTLTSGALHMDKVCPASDSKKLEASPIVTQLTHKELQNLLPHRQLFDGCGGGDGHHQSLGCSIHVLHAKLKEAMRKISRLTQEKQQLTEMGNQLRAELGSTGSEGPKPSGNPPEPTVHSSALHPKELVQKAQSRLFALEQLQYQLTKQKSPVVISDLEFQQSGSSCLEVSLQDMWQILDMGSSPSVSSTQGDSLQVNSQTARTLRSLMKSTAVHQEPKSPFTVEGTKVEVEQKSKFNKPSHAYSTKNRSSQQMEQYVASALAWFPQKCFPFRTVTTSPYLLATPTRRCQRVRIHSVSSTLQLGLDTFVFLPAYGRIWLYDFSFGCFCFWFSLLRHCKSNSQMFLIFSLQIFLIS